MMGPANRTEQPDDASKPVDALVITAPAASGMAARAGASGPIGVGLMETDQGPTIDVENMLEHGIEGYLLGDLESMATEIQPKEIGACGYPMMMAVLSGSELLGALTSDA